MHLRSKGYRPMILASRLPRSLCQTTGQQSCDQPFLVLFFCDFFKLRWFSFSKNFRCSSAVMPLIFLSLSSFLNFSAANRLSSSASASDTFFSFPCSCSRVALTLRETSGRKWAAEARKSGKRKKAWKSGREAGGLFVDKDSRRRERRSRFLGVVSSILHTN